MITDEQLQEWKRLESEATPRPWATNLVRKCDIVEANKEEPAIVVTKYIEDAALIVAERMAMPELVAEIERLRGVVRNLAAKEPTRHGWVHGGDWTLTCVYCNQFAWAGEDGKARTPIQHAESCPWRRAVEAGR